MSPEQKKETLKRLDGFLAKWLDRATTDAEAEGAVKALVHRLRAMHKVGDTDFMLMVLTPAEHQLVLDSRNGVPRETRSGETPPTAGKEDPHDPFGDALNDVFEQGLKAATKAGAQAVVEKIPGLVDQIFQGKTARAKGGT